MEHDDDWFGNCPPDTDTEPQGDEQSELVELPSQKIRRALGGFEPVEFRVAEEDPVRQLTE